MRAPLARVLLFGLAALLALGPFVFPGGLPPLHAWWLMMAAGALVVLAGTAGTAWQWTGIMTALLVVGFSSQLALTQPLWFQWIRLRPPNNFAYLFFLAIAFQSLATAGCLLWRSSLAKTLDLLRSFGLPRIVIFGALLLGVSVSPMRYLGDHDYGAFLNQVAASGAFLLLNIATIIALARSLPSEGLRPIGARAAGLMSFPGATPGVRKLDGYLPGLVAAWTLLACGLFAVIAFERIPHVPDEVAHLFQAKYFLLGQISVPPPNPMPAFEYYLIHEFDNKWFSIVSPGWPLVLSLGVLLHAPWLVNPILAAASILLAHGVFRRISDRGTANVVILLMAISPWFIATSSSLMTHGVTLTALLGSWLLLLRAREARSFAVAVAVAAGLCMGFVFLTRPLEGLTMGVLTGLWTLGCLTGRSRWTVVAGYSFGCVAIGALLFPYNAHLTGDPFLMPLQHYLDGLWHPGANRLGFGADIGPPNLWGGFDLYPGHSVGEALINSQHTAYTLNFELFGWGVGSVFLVLAHMLWGRWTRTDIYMLAVAVSTIAVAGLYWGNATHYIGPRYWFMVFLPMVAITASGARSLALRLQASGGITEPAQRLGAVMAVLGVIAIASFLTWRGVGKYHEFRGFHTDYRALLEDNDLRGGLIFVAADTPSEFASAFALNSPDLRGPAPIFARDLGPGPNKALADAFPERPIYFVTGRTGRGSRAHIVAGPLRPETVKW